MAKKKNKAKRDKELAKNKSRKDSKKDPKSKSSKDKKDKKRKQKSKQNKQDGSPLPEPPSAAAEQDRSVGIGRDATGNAIISGDGNIVVVQNITQQAVAAPSEIESSGDAEDIGPNPYKGLVAFDENDADRFYGREEQTRRLWELFRDLQEAASQPDAPPRLLPILGPSGSGKSSLARAGLIPELARRPLPSMKAARVAVLKPGSHPLEALAGVLARIATSDSAPVAKTREFASELQQTNAAGEHDGLRRIAGTLPDIAVSPLIVFVDQFEEIYSLCSDETERNAFVENLMLAVTDRGGHVSAIVTLRTDFLEETQKHDRLNSTIAERGVIIPSMKEDELRRAITEPARQAGHPLDAATIDLLISETRHREGALPLLQFALSRIWDGMTKGVKPIDTLREIGGVGGALAQEAQRIYDGLSETDRRIARRVFLNLVQLGEGTRDTRRRTEMHSLIASGDDPRDVQSVIDRFSHSGARLITLSADTAGHDTAEVTHESLFEHWKLLDQWLDESRDDLRFQRRLDQAARHWDVHGQADGLLWRPPDLDLALQYMQRAADDMTPMQVSFVSSSDDQRREDQRIARRRIRVTVSLSLAATVFLTCGLATSIYFYLQSQELLVAEQEARQEADVNFQTARQAVDDYLTHVSEETLLDQPGMQELRRSLLDDSRKYHEAFLEQRRDDTNLQDDVAASYHRLGLIDDRLGERERAIKSFQRAGEIQQQLVANNPGDDQRLYALGKTLVAQGNALIKLKRLDEALTLFNRAFDVRQDLAERNPDQIDYQRSLANVHMNIGAIHEAQDQFPQARDRFDKAQAMRHEILAKAGNDRSVRRDLAMGHFNLGTLAFYEEDIKEEPDFTAAEQHWSESIKIFAALVEEDDTDLDARYRLSRCYRTLGDVKESLSDAEELYTKAQIQLELLVKANYAVVKYRAKLGEIHYTLGQLHFNDTKMYDQAALAAAQSVEFFDELVRDNPGELFYRRMLGNSLRLLGRAEQQLQQFSKARDSFTRSIECWREIVHQSPVPGEDEVDLAAIQALLDETPAENK